VHSICQREIYRFARSVYALIFGGDIFRTVASLCREAWHSENLIQTPLIYVFHISVWGLGALFGVANPSKPHFGNGTGSFHGDCEAKSEFDPIRNIAFVESNTVE